MRRIDPGAAESWDAVLACLPAGYEEAAESLGALRRRREVRSGGDLLRLAMAYSVCDFPLRKTAGWAELKGIARLSSVALLKRLRNASGWLGWLVMRLLEDGREEGERCRWVVRIVDASVVSEKGASGTQWRLHMGLDLVGETISSLEWTDAHGGETFLRHEVSPGEVLVADRGYAHRAGVARVLGEGGHVVVRLNWQNFPLEDAEGRKIDILALAGRLRPRGIGDWDLYFRHEGRVYPVRFVVMRKRGKPTKRDIRGVEHRANKKQRTADPRTRRASCFTFLLTDLPRDELPREQVLQLYRLRWRVETAFKRLKSMLHLDHMRAHDPGLVATYVYTKLIAVLLLERFASKARIGSSPPSAPACSDLRDLAKSVAGSLSLP